MTHLVFLSMALYISLPSSCSHSRATAKSFLFFVTCTKSKFNAYSFLKETSLEEELAKHRKVDRVLHKDKQLEYRCRDMKLQCGYMEQGT
jgi:hypothetical protein